MAITQSRTETSILKTQLVAYGSSGSRSRLDLNAAYVHLTSGPALGIRINAPAAAPINELRVPTDVTTGSRAGVSVRCRVYNAGSTDAAPGSTLHATASTATYPAADDDWIIFSFATPYTPAEGETFWFVIDNTAASPTVNFPGLLVNPNVSTFGGNRFQAYSTGNGFSTTIFRSSLPYMFQIGTSWYGQPVTRSVSGFTSNTTRRGAIVIPPTNLLISSFQFTASSLFTTLQIFESTTLPGGTPLHSFSLAAIDAVTGVFRPTTPVILFRGKTYHVVLIPSGSTGLPSCGEVEDYSVISTAVDQIANGFLFCQGVQENGGVWDTTGNLFPGISCVVQEFQLPMVSYAS